MNPRARSKTDDPPGGKRRRSRELARVRELVGSLSRVDQPGLTWLDVVEELPALLDAEYAVGYSIRLEDGFCLGDHCFSRMPAGSQAVTEALLRSSSGRWGLFNPVRPEPEQQNRVVRHALWQIHERVRSSPGLRRRLGLRQGDVAHGAAGVAALEQLGLARSHQVRVLVCEGPRLLAYIGAYRREPFTTREQQLLEVVVPALQTRLSTERLLAGASVTQAALGPAIEAIDSPAFLVDEAGRVFRANSAGEVRLADSRLDTRAILRAACRGRAPGYQAVPIGRSSVPDGHLLVESSRSDCSARARSVATRWRLTQRQTQVLEQVALGHTNAAIAVTLGLTEATVKQHVAAVMSQANVETRAELAAHVWMVRG